MFGSKKRPSAIPVTIQFDKSCYTLILTRVIDAHCNAETLWQKSWTAYPDICEKNTLNTRYRLKEALSQYTASRHCYDKKLKRSRPGQFIYSDILIWLPQAVFEREVRQNTGALAALTTNLQVLHNDFYQGRVLGNRPACYTALASNSLAEDEVGFQFGAAIYVAAGNEPADCPLTAVYLDADGKQYPFMAPISYHVGKMTAENVFYQGQDNIFIINPGQHQCAKLPYSPWFSDTCSHLQLQRKEGGWRAFAANTHNSPSPIMITTRTDINADNKVEWLFEFSDSSVIPQNEKAALPRLQLRLTPAREEKRAGQPPAAMANPAAKESTLGQEQPNHTGHPDNSRQHQAWGRTVIPDANRTRTYKTIIPEQSGPSLILEGLALPRIDAARQFKGLKKWTIWFDADGNIVDGQDKSDRTQMTAVSANDREAIAYFRQPQQEFSPISPGSLLPLAGKQVKVLASPVAAYYHHLVMLLNPIQFMLHIHSAYTLGRRSWESNPEIDLALLNDPQGMEWAQDSIQHGSFLSALCLSRKHLHFTVAAERLQLVVEKDKQPVFLLNKDLSLKKSLQNKNLTSQAELLPGEYLLLGSFLLKFNR